MRSARRRKASRKLLLGLATMGLVLTAAEATCRMLFPIAISHSFPGNLSEQEIGSGFRFDEDLYWTWKTLPSPGKDVNAHGFRRTQPMAVEKPDQTQRAIVLGDSQVFGALVGTHQTFSAIAEKRLGSGWEVLNAGISGYRSLNVYRLLLLRMQQFEPDILVVNCMPFDSPREGTQVADGPLKGLPTHAGPIRAALWHSRIYYLLRHLVEKTRTNRSNWLDTRDDWQPTEIKHHGNHDLILEWASARGISVLFMEYAVADEDFELGCKTQPGTLPPGAQTIPVCKALSDSGHEGRALFFDRNHLTVLGNEVVGEALAKALQQSL